MDPRENSLLYIQNIGKNFQDNKNSFLNNRIRDVLKDLCFSVSLLSEKINKMDEKINKFSNFEKDFLKLKSDGNKLNKHIKALEGNLKVLRNTLTFSEEMEL